VLDSFTLRIDADAAIDAQALRAAPATMILKVTSNVRKSSNRHPPSLHLLWLGNTAEAPPPSPGTRFVDRRGCVLIPGMVNAHTHLDLTHVGPREYDPSEGFLGFVRTVLGERLQDEGALHASVLRGVELTHRGGVVAVGDIAGAIAGCPSLAPWRALSESGVGGVSFLEFLAMGGREEEGLSAMHSALSEWEREEAGASCIRLGLQPHATYTASLRAYREAVVAARARSPALPICTHLGENREEHELIETGTGPFRGLLERAGMWNDAVAREFGRGRSPVMHVGDALRGASFLCAHVNDASDEDIALLAECGASVAYCPRGSAYFRNHESFGPHRYRDMLRAGVNVCLGTDSIINLPQGSDDARAGRISTLDEARFLFARDGGDARELLAMCTTRGARALGLHESLFTFELGPNDAPRTIAGVVSVPLGAGDRNDPLQCVLACDTAPELLAPRLEGVRA
jgi:cytosine/adenosine deaminase-related metal-dependent hydrolase